MLWLCISLPQLPLEALCSAEVAEPIVVTHCEGNTRWIVCCNTAAADIGLKTPMNYTLALAIHPGVKVLERNPKAEAAALERLAAWAYQFSSHIVLGDIPLDVERARTASLWLEIGASLRLFGGFRHLVESFERALGTLHYSYELGIGPTIEGAALLAHAGMRVAITTPHALYERIRGLAVSRLALAPEITRQLHLVGIRTIGPTLELPRTELARRFGPETSNYLDRLMGLAPDPRTAYRLPERYAARFEFGFEVTGTEALLFAMRRMLREFTGFLTGRDTAVQRFHLVLSHRELPATELTIGSSVPDRNSERFFAIIKEQLARIALPAPTTTLAVLADEFVSPTALQRDLLQGTLKQAEDLSHTLDRISARLGEENVYAVYSVAEHRPEAAWQAAPLNDRRRELTFPDRPLWLLPEPRPLESSAIPGVTDGAERIESGWWDGEDVQRDYYIVRTKGGADLWVFRDLRDSSWYLHGFWS